MGLTARELQTLIRNYFCYWISDSGLSNPVYSLLRLLVGGQINSLTSSAPGFVPREFSPKATFIEFISHCHWVQFLVTLIISSVQKEGVTSQPFDAWPAHLHACSFYEFRKLAIEGKYVPQDSSSHMNWQLAAAAFLLYFLLLFHLLLTLPFWWAFT